MGVLLAAALVAGAAAGPPGVRSADGRWLLEAHPGELVVRSAVDGAVARRLAITSADSRSRGEAASLHVHAARRSFVVALQDLPELWEIAYDPTAEPILDGLVHDYRMGEALPRPGFLGVRRTRLEHPPAPVQVDDRDATVVVTAGAQALVVHLDTRRAMLPLPASGAARVGQSRRLTLPDGRRIFALPHGDGADWTLFDGRTWKPLATYRGATDPPDADAVGARLAP